MASVICSWAGSWTSAGPESMASQQQANSIIEKAVRDPELTMNLEL